jgi:hypothetical protein
MNFKNCILIAAILMVAVCIAAPAMAANEPSYVSKYAAPPVESNQDGCGTLYVSLLCHNGVFSNSFIIQRVDPKGIEFTSGSRVDKEFAALFPALGDNMTYAMPLVGSWDDRFAPGTYLLTLPDGNAGQPEYAVVTVAEHYPSSVSFQGHAISSSNPLIRLRPMSVNSWIDGADVNLNGLKVVKDEQIIVPESTKQVCQRVKVVDVAAYDEQVQTSAAWDETITDVAAYDETVHHNAVTHQITVTDSAAYYTIVGDHDTHTGNCKETNGAFDFQIGNKKYRIGSGQGYDLHYLYHPAVTHQETVVDAAAYDETIHHSAVTHVVHHEAGYKTVHHAEVSHYEQQCHSVIVPSYQYWTYKLEGRVSVKSIDTVITNPNGISLTGTVNVVVGYTVDHNFGHLLNTNTDLEDMTKTFTATFTGIPSGSTFYDGNIIFSDRINDAIIDEDHFPTVISSDITTNVPLGYYL